MESRIIQKAARFWHHRRVAATAPYCAQFVRGACVSNIVQSGGSNGTGTSTSHAAEEVQSCRGIARDVPCSGFVELVTPHRLARSTLNSAVAAIALLCAVFSWRVIEQYHSKRRLGRNYLLGNTTNCAQYGAVAASRRIGTRNVRLSGLYERFPCGYDSRNRSHRF